VPVVWSNQLLMLAVLAVIAAYCLVSTVVFVPAVAGIASRLSSRMRIGSRIWSKLNHLYAHLRDYSSHTAALVASLLLSFAFYLGTMFNIYFASYGLGEPIPFHVAAVATP